MIAKDEMRELSSSKVAPSDEIEIMKKYLLLKFNQGDWDKVAQAAMEIREMLANSVNKS